jgi:hypothetical protein
MSASTPNVSSQPVSYLDRHPAFLPLLIAAVFAVIGAGMLPYDYYVFLRCLLTVTGIFLIVHAARSARLGWLALAIPMIVLWAPAVFVVLPRVVWEVLDVLVAALLVVAGVLIPAPTGTTESGQKRWEWWKIALLTYGIGTFLCLMTVYSTGGGNPDCVVEYDRSGAYCG